MCKVKNQNALGSLIHPNRYPKALELNLGSVRDETITAGLEQRPGSQMLLSGSSRLDDWTPGLMRRWSAPLLWLSCCSMYWLSSAPTCSWSLKGLGRKLEHNQARYWEDRAKTPAEQRAERLSCFCWWRRAALLQLQLWDGWQVNLDSGVPTYIFCLSFRESEQQTEEEKQQNPRLSHTIVQDMDMKLFLKKENQLMTLQLQICGEFLV